eukprot:NODE_2028_length_695_cov_788.668731_g1715_i0.p1 GENE.NODE_2028_length_695_cov_788.668731_g1715_i0~~NODE_2028_length_695_cov_788.668731_g1715_i0.p1  ORF type:complete len:159 (+),score=40.68 NODE_2028_length_695_cov_788.668731_g1715_i0:123-599(+)
MLMPKKDRKQICEALFQDGVMVAKVDPEGKHPKIPVPNLHVIQLMRSFESKGYVKRQFAWRHHYWYLTNEGIEHLREYLHLPPEIVPTTLKKTPRSLQPTTRPEDLRGPARAEGGFGRGGGRDDYRRDKGSAPQDFQPSFAGGRGGGAPRSGPWNASS